MPPRFSAGSCCIIKKGCIPAIIKEAKGKKRWLVQLVEKHGAPKGTSIIELTSQQLCHRKPNEFHPMVADDDSSKDSSLPVEEIQDSDEQPRANDSPTQVRLETSFDGSVETSLMEKENGDDDNNPNSPVAQGQAGIDDNFDSDGSSYSFRAAPDSDKEDLIQNTDTNESLNENEDAKDDEQGAKPPEEQEPDMEFEVDIRNYIADIEGGEMDPNILAMGVDSSLTHTTEAHNPAHNPLSILSRLTHLLKNSLSSLT
jgi:hypothetical protein